MGRVELEASLMLHKLMRADDRRLIVANTSKVDPNKQVMRGKKREITKATNVIAKTVVGAATAHERKGKRKGKKKIPMRHKNKVWKGIVNKRRIPRGKSRTFVKAISAASSTGMCNAISFAIHVQMSFYLLQRNATLLLCPICQSI